jgi:hypothetical protein
MKMPGDGADIGHDGRAIRKDSGIQPLQKIGSFAGCTGTAHPVRLVDVAARLGRYSDWFAIEGKPPYLDRRQLHSRSG